MTPRGPETFFRAARRKLPYDDTPAALIGYAVWHLSLFA
jgi:hypothetical protein